MIKELNQIKEYASLSKDTKERTVEAIKNTYQEYKVKSYKIKQDEGMLFMLFYADSEAENIGVAKLGIDLKKG